jgi:hypothetical protein
VPHECVLLNQKGEIMCIFSANISSVANTRIFARSSTGELQFLVYSMQYEAATDLAMILPLPTPPAPAEDAVRFIDLSGYPHFFDDMANGFPVIAWRSKSSFEIAEPTLQVHDVGSFAASFVPTLNDFDRLDSRFRLPEQVWHQLPIYHDYAFAVFKLKPGAKHIHPMAFEFPRRNAAELFFPTVHIHEGKVEAKAHFDHSLYCQAAWRQPDWRVSSADAAGTQVLTAGHFMNVDLTQGIVEPDAVIQAQRVYGLHANRDIILPEADLPGLRSWPFR